MSQEYRGLAPTASRQAKAAWSAEHQAGGFICTHCGQFVSIDERMGTVNRNHCTACLWSRHVDDAKGDRAANCGGHMEPIGLTFKHEGAGKIGEIMLVHRCTQCGKLSINRIARDDPEPVIEGVFTQSLQLPGSERHAVQRKGIMLLSSGDASEVHTQLYGR